MIGGPIAVFGAGGQLGRETMRLGARLGDGIVGFGRAEVDIADAGAVARAIADTRPRLVVNAAAYTAVDKAESDLQGAMAANATGPETLALAAAAAGTPIVHLSTDYVFDGTKQGAYVEADPIAPLGAYGHTKAKGEALVRAANPRHIIIRTAWVYGPFGANFLKTMLRLARERDELRVVADQHGCPTATIDLAEAVFAVDRVIADGGSPWGLYNFAGTGVTTWHEFASEIVAAAAPSTGKSPRVMAIRTEDYPTPAKRPANSELDSGRFATIFGYRAAPWRQRTLETVHELSRAS